MEEVELELLGGYELESPALGRGVNEPRNQSEELGLHINQAPFECSQLPDTQLLIRFDGQLESNFSVFLHESSSTCLTAPVVLPARLIASLGKQAT